MNDARSGVRTATRRLLFGGGPVERRPDRIQAALRVLLVAALLAAAPLALWQGTSTEARLQAVVAAQLRALTAVRAEVLVDAVAWPAPAGDDGVPTTVGWTTSRGVTRTALVRVPSATRAGATVTEWLDRRGTPAPAPRDRESIAAASVSAGVTALAVLLVGPLALYGASAVLLNRWRAHCWSAEWAAIEPLWTRHLH